MSSADGLKQFRYQNSVARMRGGPGWPLMTSVAMTTCRFLSPQFAGARLASSSRYTGFVRNPPAAIVPHLDKPAAVTIQCSVSGFLKRELTAQSSVTNA